MLHAVNIIYSIYLPPIMRQLCVERSGKFELCWHVFLSFNNDQLAFFGFFGYLVLIIFMNKIIICMSESELTLRVWIFNWIIAVMDIDFKLHLSFQDCLTTCTVNFCKSRLPLASTPPKWKVVETLSYVHIQYQLCCSHKTKCHDRECCWHFG